MTDETIRQIAEKYAQSLGTLRVLLIPDCEGAIREAVALARQQQWIPVTEKMPEQGVDVLVFCPNALVKVQTDEWVVYREAPLSFSSATIETGEGWSEHDFDDVTHWQPLPDPPQ